MDARRAAWTVLRAVDEQGAYANLLLPRILPDVPERDRALAVELAYGSLRALGTLDHVLGLVSSRPLADVDPPLRDALRLGAYQLLRTRVPPHAAVSTTVDLVRRELGPRPVGFANAVLRKVAARGGDLGAPAYDEDPVGHLAVVHAHPRWVVEAFRDALGGDLDETAAALAADDTRPEVHLVARSLDRTPLLALPGAEPTRWSPYGVRLTAGGVPDAPVQDEGSQLAAVALANLAPGARLVADLCAGPGGKAALLAALLPDARLVAADVHEHRAVLVRQSVPSGPAGAPAPASPYVVRADSRTPPWRDGTFDAALLDAPCTGLGALRRRPEARWRKRPDDVPRLARLQRELLASALRGVRPGGVVLYVVCSPHLAESRDVVAGIDAEPLDVRAALPPGMPGLGGGPWVQFWPHRHGTDALFLAAFRA